MVRPPFPFTLAPYLETYHSFLDRSFFWSKGKWWLTLGEGKVEIIRLVEKGDSRHPLLEITLEEEKMKEDLFLVLGLREDPSPFYQLANQDPVMSKLVSKFYGGRIPRSRTLFEAAVTTILEQQISMRVASVLRQRLVEKWGQGPFYREGETIFAFPTAWDLASIPPEELKKVGMSSAKARTIQQLAKMIKQKEIDPASLSKLPSSQVVDLLTRIPGLGPWSAKFIIARWLPTNDCFAQSDLGLRKAVAFFYRGSNHPVSTSECEEILERFSPYQRWAGWYLLMAIEKEKSSPAH